MENQSNENIGNKQNSTEASNNNIEGTRSPGSLPQVPPPHQDQWGADNQQDNTESSGEGIHTQNEKPAGLAQGYNLENALHDYDAEERRPQIAEFWKFNSATLKKQGHF